MTRWVGYKHQFCNNASNLILLKLFLIKLVGGIHAIALLFMLFHCDELRGYCRDVPKETLQYGAVAI